MTSALAFLREGVPAAVRRAFGDFLPEIAVLPLKGGKNGGWAVEPTRVFMLGLLSYLREEALQRGLLLRTHGQDMPVGNAGVSSTRIVQVTTCLLYTS
ncbi:MAG: hypothetical protein N2595_05850, partial [bacterium]|nr:hypothetical protein [bacterium]